MGLVRAGQVIVAVVVPPTVVVADQIDHLMAIGPLDLFHPILILTLWE